MLVFRGVRLRVMLIGALLLLIMTPARALPQPGAPGVPPVAVEAALDARPNFVFVLVDDLGFADFSPTRMPLTHRLMERSGTQMKLYTQQNCVPSRVALLTGDDPSVHGLHGVPSIPSRFGLDSTTITFAEELQQAGYATGAFGKWHLGEAKDVHPNRKGFDEFLGPIHGHLNSYGPKEDRTPYRDGSIGHDHHGAHDLQINGVPLYSQKSTTELFTDAAIDFIDRNRERPFYAYVPYNQPHAPYAAPRRFVEELRQSFGISQNQIDLHLDEYADRMLAVPSDTTIDDELRYELEDLIYYAAVRHLDEQIHRIHAKLVAEGIDRNTVFVFASDNGASLTTGLHGDNSPLRGGKGLPYEGGHRVANFMVWPFRIEPGQEISSNVWIGDIGPTFLDLAGVTPLDRHQGVSVKEAWLDDADVLRPSTLGGTQLNSRAIVSHISKRRYGAAGEEIDLAIWAINNADQKYIRRVRFDPDGTYLSEAEEYYRIDTDIGETTNLINDPAHQAAVARMRTKFELYGGVEYLQGLETIVAVGWSGYTVPKEWGFPEFDDLEDYPFLQTNLL